MGPIFNEKVAKKWNLWVHEQYMMHCLLQKSQHLRLLFIDQYMNSNAKRVKKTKKKKTKRTKTQNADGFKTQTCIQTSTKYLKYKWNFYLLIPFKFPQYGRIKNERFEGGKITLKIPLNASSWALKKNLKGSLNSSPPSLYSLFLPLHLNTVRSLITLKRPFQGPCEFTPPIACQEGKCF